MYLWSTGDTSQIISFDSTGIGLNTISVFVTVTSGICETTDTITITYDPCVNINETQIASQLTVFPNPNNGIMTINIQSENNSNITISLIDINGRTLKNKEIKVSGEYSEELDIREYSKGIYYLKIVSNTETIMHKLIYQ